MKKIILMVAVTFAVFGFAKSTNAQGVPVATSTDNCYTFSVNLTVGDSGNDVSMLQARLVKEGYSITQTGYFGPITKASVMLYQSRIGIPSTGFVGPVTRAQLNSSCDSGPSITVVSPNGGEAITPEKGDGRLLIRWNSTGIAVNNNVQIGIIDTRYSTEGGERAEQIITNSIPNTGSFSWQVPRKIGTMSLDVTELPVYKIKVYSHATNNGTAISDSSNDPFSILLSNPEAVSVNYPKGGENLVSGDQMLVKWTPVSPISSIEAVLLDGSYGFLLYGPKNGDIRPITTGEFSFVVPSNIVSGKYYIKLTPSVDAAAEVISKTFSINEINQSPVKVSTLINGQAGKTSVNTGANFTLSYHSAEATYCRRDMNERSWPLADGSGMWDTITSNRPTTWSVTLKNDRVAGISDPISIICYDNNGHTQTDTVYLSSVSDSQPSITVLSPNGGESFTMGNSLQTAGTIRVQWRSYGLKELPEKAIGVALRRSGDGDICRIGTISSYQDSASIGVYEGFACPSATWNLSPGSYKAYVYLVGSDVIIDDNSDNYFTIKSATTTSPTITTWTGPTSVTAGTNLSYRINFNTVKTTADQTIFVHFVDSTGTNRFVSSVPPSTRTTQWTGAVSTPITVAVPAGIPTGTYKVMAGLYTTASGRLPLTAGSGVTVDSQTRYQVGTITVNAPTTAFSLSCAPSVTSATTGTTVTWNATATGGIRPYKYYFSDVANQITDNTTGSITRAYTTTGQKYMSIAVIDAANTKVDWAFCTGNVNVTTPTVTPPPVTPPTTPPVTYCEISAPSCPKYPTYQGTTRDTYLGSDKDQTKCLARASAFVPWCGAKLPVTARYYSDGAKVGEQVAQPVSTTGYIQRTSLMSSVWGAFMNLLGN